MDRDSGTQATSPQGLISNQSRQQVTISYNGHERPNLHSKDATNTNSIVKNGSALGDYVGASQDTIGNGLNSKEATTVEAQKSQHATTDMRSSSSAACTPDEGGTVAHGSINPEKPARQAAPSTEEREEEAGGVESSSSSGTGEMLTSVAREHTSIYSDRDSAGGSGSNGSGSRNVVTATTTTSSGDDRDSSGGTGSGNSGGVTSENSGPGLEHLRSHHHHHRNRRRAAVANDGSRLQVPGDDGSDRLTRGVPTAPATVVAARLPAPNTDTTNTTSSSGSGGEGETHDSGSLLQPHREPGYHTIRRTFSKLPRRDTRKDKNSSVTDTSSVERTMKKFKTKHASDLPPKAKKKKASPCRGDDVLKPRKKIVAPRDRGSPSPESVNSNPPGGGGGGSSSGSGTEGGYAGSASSNEIAGQQEAYSSPSVSSSEDSRPTKSKRHRAKEDGKRKASKESDRSGDSSSSEIADFSSGASESGVVDGGFTIKTFTASPSASPSLSSSSNGEGSSDDLEENFLRAKMEALEDQAALIQATTRKRRANTTESQSWKRHRVLASSNAASMGANETVDSIRWPRSSRGRLKDDAQSLHGRPPILALGSDVMAHVLTFLEPPDILDVLTMPLSKDWRTTFTSQPELWRVLCLVEPFKAQIDDEDDASTSSSSLGSLAQDDDPSGNRLLGRYRLLYTSFVRCMRYLSQIKDDAVNGRPPSFIDYGVAGGTPSNLIGTNKSLKSFLARARNVVNNAKRQNSGSADSTDTSISAESGEAMDTTGAADSGRARRKSSRKKSKQKKPRIGPSMLTQRLLAPSPSGQPGNLNLPWSCAVYSIVNWMVAFSDVEGIQTLCLKVLPLLLENEQQRITSQRAGLTDVVLRGMVAFPDSVQLHTAAFHTIVLLARPLGGREGMLFHSSMVNASGIFGSDSAQNGKNGIAVMLESMRRFEANDVLQAMSCWSLVNIALAPAQKTVLVKLGGIQVTANAMKLHPYSAEVQFRALFALINLVIPSVRMDEENPQANGMEQVGEVNDASEKEALDDLVGDITSLVVLAMTSFCSSEAILNRACLVLHNLSLTQEYHETLLWTPNCYQMLEWCLANYRTDQVLQQSATGTLHRLQMTLSSDADLRSRFAESLQTQQQLSLEQAHREAIHLHEEQERLQQERLPPPPPPAN